MPRPNGYQSLHTSVISEHGVPFEVQIRTIEMHRRAEEGRRRALEVQGRARGHAARRAVLPVDAPAPRHPEGSARSGGVHPEPEVELYRRKCTRVRSRRKGSSRRSRRRDAIDFAYSIHTDVGINASARASNGRWCRCARRWRTATCRDHHAGAHKPSRDWLNSVVTAHGALRDQALDRRRGKDACDRARPQAVREGSAALRPEPKTLLDGAAFAKALSDVGAQKADDLSRPSATASCNRSRSSPRWCPPTSCARNRPRARSPLWSAGARTGDEKIKVRGFDDLMVFAAVLQPDRGEKIVGYITRGKGVSVHSATVRTS